MTVQTLRCYQTCWLSLCWAGFRRCSDGLCHETESTKLKKVGFYQETKSVKLRSTFVWMNGTNEKQELHSCRRQKPVQNKYERNQMVKSSLHGDIVAPTVSLFNLHNFKKRGRKTGRKGKGSWVFLFSLYIRSGWLQVNLSKNTFYYSQTELCYYFKYTSTNTQKHISKKEPKDKIKTSTLNYLSFYKHKRLKYFRGDKNPALLPWSVAF